MSWKFAVELSELRDKPFLLRVPPKQIAVFAVDDQVFAVDNRCPHEGYPLLDGHVDRDVGLLTCVWHNWKFRLTDGKCVLGGDHVRSYPVELRSGQVWVNLAEPSRESIKETLLEGLQAAFDQRDFGRICREIARLHFHELDPFQAVRFALAASHDRFEFGMTHAYACAADWISLARQYHDRLDQNAARHEELENEIICIAEAVDHIAFDVLRQPHFPYGDRPVAFTEVAFYDAVESEQAVQAESLIANALRSGLHWEQLEGPLTQVALSHYGDFGHSLIYVYKAGQLIELLGADVEQYVLGPLVRSLCLATREDLLPPFSSYRSTVDQLRTMQHEPASEEDAIVGLFPATTDEALTWLQENYACCPGTLLYDELLKALARNLLCFDKSVDEAVHRPVVDNVGWLHFTHGITFANAVRALCERHPQYWILGLAQMACFVGRNRKYLDLKADVARWFVEDEDAFWIRTNERVLDHGLRDPIFSAHLLKTIKAVEAECRIASPACRNSLLAALNRFLNASIKQKHVRRLTRQAIGLVARDFVE